MNKFNLSLWIRARNLDRLKNKQPIILCDNCWAGSIYSFLHLEYYTPLIGTYIYPESFLNLIKNFPEMFLKPLFFSHEPSHGRRKGEPNYYPVGLIDNKIEIHFLHYKSEAEVLEKWNRRTERMLEVYEKNKVVFFKMDDSNFGTEEDFIKFHNTNIGYKVSFSKKHLINHPNHFKIKLKNEWVSGKNSSYNFDIIHFLNTGIAKQTLLNILIRRIYNKANYA